MQAVECEHRAVVRERLPCALMRNHRSKSSHRRICGSNSPAETTASPARDGAGRGHVARERNQRFQRHRPVRWGGIHECAARERRVTREPRVAIHDIQRPDRPRSAPVAARDTSAPTSRLHRGTPRSGPPPHGSLRSARRSARRSPAPDSGYPLRSRTGAIAVSRAAVSGEPSLTMMSSRSVNDCAEYRVDRRRNELGDVPGGDDDADERHRGQPLQGERRCSSRMRHSSRRIRVIALHGRS